jgi:NADPH2:quinone reductase
MPKAIIIEEFGGPEVMQMIDSRVLPPNSHEVTIRNTAIGLNFIDTYHRSGLYPVELPSHLGLEGSAVVTDLGKDVDGFKLGDRVAYVDLPIGAYSEQRNYPADRLVKIPESIPNDLAAASMLKGLTAWYLANKSYPIKVGDDVLIYAVAGGVGLFLCQWAKHLGARVIGIVSTSEKAELAQLNGCAEIIYADDEQLVKKIRELTNGKGVTAVYDSVGKDTFYQSLDCLRPHGVMVSYGNATGTVEPFPVLELASRGSLFVTRPVLSDFIKERQDLVDAADELFTLISKKVIRVHLNTIMPLSDVAEAHANLESRATTGSTILKP